jgi:precorrin isomerase
MVEVEEEEGDPIGGEAEEEIQAEAFSSVSKVGGRGGGGGVTAAAAAALADA